MKKNLCAVWYFSRRVLPKTFLVMKLTAILLMAAFLQISAKSYSQRVTLLEKNAPLGKVFRAIKKQTGYSFFFDESWILQADAVTISVKDASLETALNICFKNQPLTFTIVGSTVVVKQKEENAFASQNEALAVVDISGVITDTDKRPLAGVSIKIKGTNKGTVTNINGEYTLHANPGDVLEITFVGFQKQEIKVGDNTRINIVLQASTSGLGEVVVTALGIVKNDKTLGYAITTVKGEELTRTNTVNPITALQGKVAGVNINVQTASGIQSSPFIQIRGAKVIGGPGNNANQPIFVVDGIVLTNNLSDADGADLGSQLKNLNPDDYESITVLKGAAATSIYGSRGINGAVVITTKSGKAGKGLGVEFNSTTQIESIYKSPIAYQNSYGQGSWATREGAFATDGTQAKTMFSFGPAYDGSMHPAIYKPDSLVPYVAVPDNWKTFYQNGAYVNNNIALTGGSEKLNFRFSYSNNQSKGLLPNNNLKRNAFDLKIRGQINKVFSTDIGISYAHTFFDNWVSQGRYYYGGGQNLAFNTFYLPRNLDVAAWYKTYRAPDNTADYVHAYSNLSSVINAFSNFDKNDAMRRENSLLSYMQLKAQVTSWLDLSARGNISLYKISSETRNKGNGTNNTGGYYAVDGSYSSTYTLLFSAHANKKINDFGVDFRLLNEIYGNMWGESWSASTNGGLKVPNVFLLSNSLNPAQAVNYSGSGVSGGNSSVGFNRPSTLTAGLGGILNLSYKDIINLELTGRNDWLSTLTYPATVPGNNNYSVFYPSANVSYNIYSHLQKEIPAWISSARLRASLAYVGNSGIAGPYQTGMGFNSGAAYNQNGQIVSTAYQANASTLPNLNLKPQVQRSWEFGTNFGLLKELINVDFAWYKTNTIDQLVRLGGVPETGYSTYFLNAGNIQNKGWEILVTGSPIRKKDLSWDIAINMGHNKSKIVKFGNGITQWELSGGYDGANVFAYEGGDFGVLTSDVGSSTKIDPKTNFPIITVGDSSNSAGSQHLLFYNYASPDDKVKIGKVEPTLTGGVSTNLRYKNFTLFAQVDGRFGGYVYSEALNYAMAQGTPAQSLQYRDQAHGGVKRTDSYTGKDRYDGVIIDGVFDQGQKSPKTGADIGGMTFREAYEKGLVDPVKASVYYVSNFGWGTNINSNGTASQLSWVMLREITLGYKIPTKLINNVFNAASVNFSVRNIGYLYNSLSGGQNPASLQGNDPFRPYISGGVPFSRTYAIALHINL
ncbi:SusC/RagA family TonB-linked outer membrane protein [Chitinophaga sp. Ak27]|uniref:SusC/RagA family TonB-linked outer membrane protein n=1 Tax=Chitinophaga sp. Ak27 TaxID=2726116 RepID=UPI00145DB8F3|nr:SusC/RagA family TonB-linked outer membrane protein [Chitinophaga sp. Ak27]NLU90488.1 SusC/RagA family TonB-linked outer membrane protein [Chitinophaga sp. Ak27]